MATPTKLKTTSSLLHTLSHNMKADRRINGTIEATQKEANHYLGRYIKCHSFHHTQQITFELRHKNININSVILNADPEILKQQTSYSFLGFGGRNFCNAYVAMLFRQFTLNDKTLSYLLKHSEIDKNYTFLTLLAAPFNAKEVAPISEKNMDYLIKNTNYTEEDHLFLDNYLKHNTSHEVQSRNLLATYFSGFDYLSNSGAQNNILTQKQIALLIDKSDMNILSYSQLVLFNSMKNIFEHIEISEENLDKIVGKLKLNDKKSLSKFTMGIGNLMRGETPGAIAFLDRIDIAHNIDWVKLISKDKRQCSVYGVFPYLPTVNKEALLFEKKIPITPQLQETILNSPEPEDQALLEKRLLLDNMAPEVSHTNSKKQTLKI